MRKQVFRNYSYTQVDEFADFLHEMSLQGWHFVSWGAGLEFEQGEHKDVCYAVEVFEKGHELDTKPESKTEEFAEYCKAAGWKLLDSKRKFCIFEKIKEDAEPFFTEEERFYNVSKAERKVQFPHVLVSGLATYIWWDILVSQYFENLAEYRALLAVTLLLTAQFVTRMVRFGMYEIWQIRGRKLLKEGNEIFYGIKGKNRFPVQLVWHVVITFLFPILFMWLQMWREAIACLILFAFIDSILFCVGKFRPTRVEHRMIEVYMSVGFLFLLLFLGIVLW